MRYPRPPLAGPADASPSCFVLPPPPTRPPSSSAAASSPSISKAFFALRAHKGQVIVSIRASTVSPAWAVVKSVTPEAPGRRAAASRPPPRLQSTYYHLARRAREARDAAGGATGRSGARLPGRGRLHGLGLGDDRTIDQLYRSVCAGLGRVHRSAGRHRQPDVLERALRRRPRRRCSPQCAALRARRSCPQCLLRRRRLDADSALETLTRIRRSTAAATASRRPSMHDDLWPRRSPIATACCPSRQGGVGGRDPACRSTHERQLRSRATTRSARRCGTAARRPALAAR